jgi:ribosomal protein S18 acetylase RimI-like enzyme
MADIRAGDWGSAEMWKASIHSYLTGERDPQMAKKPRVAFVAASDAAVIGLIAGHLTQRFRCDGELQWISVRPEYRRRSVADQLLRLLAQWFADRDAARVCVDVVSTNVAARRFYSRNGAVDLKPSWMVWDDIRRLATSAKP